MEGGTQPPEGHPFGKRLEIVDRLHGLDFDDGLDLPSSIGRRQDDIRIDGGRAAADRAVLLGARVDADVETTAKLSL